MQRAPFNPEEAVEVMTITATSNGFMNEFIEDMQRTLIAEIPEMTEEDIFLKVGKVAIQGLARSRNGSEASEDDRGYVTHAAVV